MQSRICVSPQYVWQCEDCAQPNQRLVIVVDSSGWIECLRRTGSRVHVVLGRLVLGGANPVVTEIVAMELLAGARDVREEERLRVGPLALPILPWTRSRTIHASASSRVAKNSMTDSPSAFTRP